MSPIDTGQSLCIGIAGAGLAGRLMAWRLARLGHRVSLFDRDCRGGELAAGRVAAAMLAPYSEIVSADDMVFAMGRRSLTRWPELLTELTADSGMAVDFRATGSVAIAHARDRSELERFYRRLVARSAVPRDAVCQLDESGLASIEPELAGRFREGLYLPEEGCLDNWGLLDALAVAIERFGGDWFERAEVSTVAPGVIVTSSGRHRFDLAIDCRGCGAKPQLEGLRGVRGEVLWVEAREVHLDHPIRMMHPRYQLYIAPKPQQRYVIGATELESESMAPVTVRSALELLSALYSVHCGFAEAKLIRSFANCRPAFMDHLPQVITGDGLLRINGLYRHGYLLSPAVTDEAMSLLGTPGLARWHEISCEPEPVTL